jgi:hypothetical protein
MDKETFDSLSEQMKYTIVNHDKVIAEVNKMEGYSMTAEYEINGDEINITTKFVGPAYEIKTDNPINYDE